MYIGTAEQGELQESKRPPGSSGASVRSGVVLVRCCCMRGIYSCMHGERRQPQQRSPVEQRETDESREGWGNRWTGVEYKLRHENLEGAEKSGEIQRTERCWRKTDEKRIKFNLDKNLKKVWRTHRTTFPCDSYAIPWNQYTRMYICNICMHHAS